MFYDDDKDDEDEKDDKDEKKPWGFASYDVDDDDPDNPTIIYTRHEVSGRVNQYVDNGDGGHGHFSWKNEDDYENDGEDNNTTDYSRPESNSHENPSQSEVEERSGCYLTSACIAHYKDSFDDNCYELSILRWFRDKFVSKKDVQHYYKVAPKIVQNIEKEQNSELIFNKIYLHIVVPCVRSIEDGEFISAYDRYKKTILAFENKYLNSTQSQNISL